MMFLVSLSLVFNQISSGKYEYKSTIFDEL